MPIVRRMLWFSLCVFAFLASAQAQNTLKIGVINPFSGPLALYGTEVTRGVELAVDVINAKGGLLGKKVEVIRGDAANPQQGIATVEQLATRDKVDIFMGTYISSISLTASDTAARYNKLYWETNAVAQNLIDRGLPNFVRSGPDGGIFASTSVATVSAIVTPSLKKNIKDVKIWIEHEDSIYGTSIGQAQKSALEAMGAKIVGIGAHSAKSIDLNDSILRAKQVAPDIYLQTGYVPDGNLLLRTARDQGFKPAAIILVGTGDTPETLESLGADFLEGVLVVGYPKYDMPESYGPGIKAYLSAYRAKFKGEPQAPQSMASYSGTLIMFEAITLAGSVVPEKVQAAVTRLDKAQGTYPTGFGAKFEKSQNIRAFMTTSQWQGGKLVTVYPKEATPPGAALKNMPRK
ncbi:MAG: ABC transporter substrate-binding protein [Limnohabitans sp.]|nr:ABC transporter substrate-binding protein [Limnohabitans sp.]